LHTMVLPQARAGATFQVSRYRGRFQGVTRAVIVLIEERNDRLGCWVSEVRDLGQFNTKLHG